MNRMKVILRQILMMLGWVPLVMAVLLTTLLAGWILLAEVLVGGLTPSQPIPVIPILGALIAVTGGLAWPVTKYIASPRSVVLVIGLILALFLVIGVTWALSSPETALFLARDMAWDGTDVLQVQQFPERAISSPPSAFHFQQNLAPQLFETITYNLNGQEMQTDFEEFLKTSQTTSFIVIKDGAVIYEGYFNGYNRDSVVTSFSIAKPFTSALVGIAIDEGYIHSIYDPIVDYLPELRGKGLDGVTIRHLLTMSTGVRYIHGEELPGLLRPLPFSDDSWTTSFPDLRSLALSVKPDGEVPGSAWKYNNYCPQLLGLILERATHRSVSEYLQEKIWQPLGMEYPATWSLDSKESDFEKMEQGINARAIDFAKFGQLFLNNGSWGGKQIIPKQWVIDSTSPDPNDNRPWRIAAAWKEANGYYGYFWWGQVRPDGSYAYMARGGMQQQWIYVSPRDRVVIVRFGLVEGGADSWPDVFENVISRMY
jgi:CubicO group peptidase (beta-lactamase class C family)